MNRLLRPLAIASLVLGGTITWGSATGWLNPGQNLPLSALGQQFGPLHSVLIHDVDSGLLGDLPPDSFTFQTVQDDADREGLLYIAYYRRSRRWSGRPHELTICYRAIGYDLLDGRQLQTAAGSRYWLHHFSREGKEVQVLHWLQRPGMLPGEEGVLDHLKRIFSPQGLRQDVVSAYLEFPVEAGLGEDTLLLAATAISEDLAEIWKL